MADNASPETPPSAVEDIHKSCPVDESGNEPGHDDDSPRGEQDTDFPPFPLNCDGIPVNWSQEPCLQQEQYILVELRPGLPEYDKIVEEFSRMNIRVTRIERLQNKGHLERFMAEVEEMKKDRGNDSNPNIRYLYHGTSLEKQRLCENGLDQSSSTKDNLGPDLYLSTKPLKCIHYAKQRNQTDISMILKCRVILDDDKGTPEEYVVHEDRWVMVEYLISIEVDDGNAELIAKEAEHDAPDYEHSDREQAAAVETVVAEKAGHDAPDDEHPERDEAACGETVVAEKAGHDAPDDEHPERDEAAGGESVITEEVENDTTDDDHTEREESSNGETAVITEEVENDTTDDDHTAREESSNGETVITEEVRYDAPNEEHSERNGDSDGKIVITEEVGYDASNEEHSEREDASDGETADDSKSAGHDAPDDEHRERDKGTSKERWRTLVIFIIVWSFGYIITPYIIRLVLWVLGFTAQGVVKGSIAAKWHSFIGVTSGSWFAVAQSTAATGIVSEWTRIIGAGQTGFLPQHGGVDLVSFQEIRFDNKGSNQDQGVRIIQDQRGSGHFDMTDGNNHGNMGRNPLGHQHSFLGMRPHLFHQNSLPVMPPHFGSQNSLLGMPPHLSYSAQCNLNFDQNQQTGREKRKVSVKTNVSRRKKRQDGETQSHDFSAYRPQSVPGEDEIHRGKKLSGQTKGSADHRSIDRSCGRKRGQHGRRGGSTDKHIDTGIIRSSNVDAHDPVETRTERKPQKRRQRRREKTYDRSYEKVIEKAIGASPPTARDATVSDTDDSTSSSSTFQNERLSQSKKTVDVLLSKFKDLGDQIAKLKVSKSDLQIDLPPYSSKSTHSSKLKSHDFKTSLGSLKEEKKLPKERAQVQDIQMDIGIWDESLYRETTEPPGEKEVFRYLIKVVGGPTSVKNIAGTKLFPKDFDILSWFHDHRRRFILFENKGKNDQFIVPFYKEATFCLDYNNIGMYDICNQLSCPHAHICKDFVGGSCRQGQKCRFSHNFYDRANFNLISKLGLDVFSNEEIRLIYSQRYPRVCGYHTPTRRCHLSACAYLHICKRNLLGRCDREFDCPLGHTFETDHNKYVIKAYHLSNMKEPLVKKIIFIGPSTSKGNIQQKGRSTHGSRESINEERNMSPNRLNKIAKSRINFQKEQKRKPQSRHKANNDGREHSRSSSSPSPMRFSKDHIGNDDIFKRDLMTNKTQEEAMPLPMKGNFQVEEMQMEEKSTVISPDPGRASHLEPKVVNKNPYIGGAKPKEPRPRHRSSNEEETTSQDSVLETNAAQSTPICDLYLVNKCKSATCKFHHHDSIKLPYIWQIPMFNSWLTLDKLKMIEVERAYCDKASTYQTMVIYGGSNYNATLEFHMPDSLTAVAVKDGGSAKFKIETSVRRLSTRSYAEGTKPSSKDSFKTQWRWFYMDAFGIWCLMEPELLQFTLEQKFTRKCQDMYLFCHDNYQFKYSIDFKNMKQINIETGKERKILRRPLFVSAEDVEFKHYPEKISIPSGVATPLPAGWVPWDLAHAFELVELKRDSVEFQKVESSFFASLPTHEFHIMYICRVQNMELWMAYDGQKKSMKVSLERSGQTKEVDERNLFHGTDTLDTVQGICTNCFDFRVCGKHGTVYGKGSYFARDAKYSHSYTNSSNTAAVRYMFLAKVLVGEYTTGCPNYTRPPEKPGATAHQLFDSCVNNVDNPSIFVVFDLNQCYPEYLICYKEMAEFPFKEATIAKPNQTYTPSQVTKVQPPLPDQSAPQPSSKISDTSSIQTVYQRQCHEIDDIKFKDNHARYSIKDTFYQRQDHEINDTEFKDNNARYSIRDANTTQEICCIQ
ncbi:hypothetical protein CHS0354_022881 [Potamilus streckersoni]|uniref:Poly [ADP-ribose] polymerase n=1 Tax=Potamilus streckersoni TaxID=2493646 RepID=A0AAE0S1V4_9BIVA|nr:hypothetical protein CHS0354_022881 [Potamilus streckersoni]